MTVLKSEKELIHQWRKCKKVQLTLATDNYLGELKAPENGPNELDTISHLSIGSDSLKWFTEYTRKTQSLYFACLQGKVVVLI